MHTTVVDDTAFIHPPDVFSDDDPGAWIEIVRPDGRLKVPAGDLVGFIAALVRTERVCAFEQAEEERSDREVLGLPPAPKR